MRAVVVNATNEIGNCFTTIETTPTLVARSCTLLFVGLNSFLNGRAVPYGVAYLLEPIGSNACATTLTQQWRGCLLSAQKRAHINFIEASICQISSNHLSLLLAFYGERRIIYIQTIFHPFRFSMTNEGDAHSFILGVEDRLT